MQDQSDDNTPAAEMAKISAIFDARAGITPSQRDVSTLPYLLSLVRAHPRQFMDSPDYRAAVGAMRTLAAVVPRLIEKAETAAAQERQAGRDTWLDRYAMQCRALRAAIEPFGLARRDQRGWWHGWARMAETEIRLIFHRHSKIVSFANPTAPAVLVVCDLMGLAGHSVTPAAIVDAITK